MTTTTSTTTVGVSTARPRRAARRQLPERAVLYAFLAPAVAYVAVFFAYPLAKGVLISLQRLDFAALVSGHAPFVGTANYHAMLSQSTTRQAILNTVVFTVGSIAFQFVIGFAMALYFNHRFRGNDFLRRLILIPWVMPLVAVGTMFQLVFATSNGLVNEVLQSLGIIHAPVGWLANGTLAVLVIVVTNIWAGVPFNALLLYSGLQDVPGEVLEAASVDGANPWQRLIHVVVPAMRQVILIVLMLGVVYTVKAFDLVIILTDGGPANESQLLSSWAYTQAFTNFQFGDGMAVSNILLAFCLVVGCVYLWISRRDNAMIGGIR